MPASTCFFTMSPTVRASIASSIALPVVKCSRTACRICGGRGRLPVCVVRILVIALYYFLPSSPRRRGPRLLLNNMGSRLRANDRHMRFFIFLFLFCAAAHAQYPDKPIRLVVGFSAGGPTDLPARFIADRLGATFGQRVVVENR